MRMNEFVKIILSLSVSGTLLLFLLLGLRQLCKNRFSRRWQYYIWLVAALRFLIPVTTDASIVGSLFEKIDMIAAMGENKINSSEPVAHNAEEVRKDLRNLEEHTAQKAEGSGKDLGNPVEHAAQKAESGEKDFMNPAARGSLKIELCLFWVWLAVALVLLARKIVVYRGFVRFIRAGNTEISDLALLNLLSDCEEWLQIRTRVELSCNALVTSPMLLGFFRPCIVLPDRELEEKDLSYILVHELIHYKQRDIFYKWLVQMVVCIHWFNPFVYLLEKEINKSCELSCDETVLSVFGDSAKREYGDMLLSFVRADSPYKNSVISITLTEGAGELKERLGAIMKYQKKSKIAHVVAVVCTAAVCTCFMATGAYAAPPGAHGTVTWKDDEIQNEVLTKDGVYFILCDGAREQDKPQASVSSGSILLVVVRKDSYTTIGPFDDMETLMEDVAKQCEYMKNLTSKEKELVLKTAADIDNSSTPALDTQNSQWITDNNLTPDTQEGQWTAEGAAGGKDNRYTYVHRGFYSDAYIIEMGWNLTDTMDRKNAGSREITLPDHSTMVVYYGNMPFGDSDSSAAAYMNDANAVSAIANLIVSLKNKNLPGYPAIEAPWISKATYVGSDLPSLAEAYLESGNAMGFAAVFAVLDEELQAEYCQRLYADDQIALFASIIPYLAREDLVLYAGKAGQDSTKRGFFAVLLPYMQPAEINMLAEKYYEADDFGQFAGIVFYMMQSQKQEWLTRAETDHRSQYAAFLSNTLPKE